MEPDISWIYLAFFLLIPLARIIPRIVSKIKKNNMPETEMQNMHNVDQYTDTRKKPQTKPQTQKPQTQKPQTKNMLVLGALNHGLKTFESIQKNTGLESSELEDILNKLERDEMLLVRQKQGMLGVKVELFPTDKGFKEYYS